MEKAEITISNRTKKPITNRPKKGKKFASNSVFLDMITQVNNERDRKINTKQEAERSKRQALLEVQMKQEASKNEKKGKKENRIKELKEQLTKKKEKVSNLTAKIGNNKKVQKSFKKNMKKDVKKSGKKVSFAA